MAAVTVDAPPVGPAVGPEERSKWSSLPPDLVRRIADLFLAADELDCYVYFRAVCPSWRDATDDPKNHASELRFRPRRWIILDEHIQAEGKLLLLLHTATGRFVRRKLPQRLELDYYVVATAFGGFIILAERRPPHAACLFNPLTGALTRFSAPVPQDAVVADVLACDNASFILLLLGDSSHMFYTASPGSEAFESECYLEEQHTYNFLRKLVIGGAYSHMFEPESSDAVDKLQQLLWSLHADPAKFFSKDHSGDATHIQCFVVALGINMVLVVKIPGSFLVFDMDTQKGELVPLKSITRCAIFVGHRSCLVVDAHKFPGIDANCVYYTEHLGLRAHICKCSIMDKKAERISEADEFQKQGKQFVLVAERPFTIVQLLCSYTLNRRDSELALQQMV